MRKKNKKLMSKKEFKRKLAKKVEKIFIICSIITLVYFITCYVNIAACNVSANKELATWNVAHDFKMEITSKN